MQDECHGRLVQKDEDKAFDYFREASGKGFNLANYNLGRMFELFGYIDKAIEYYTEAALNNEPYSMKKLVEFWGQGYLKSISKEDIDAMKKGYIEIGLDKDDLELYMIK